MYCANCENNLTLCICDDVDERIDKLQQSKILLIDWEALKAQRYLNRFEIERLKKTNKQNNSLTKTD